MTTEHTVSVDTADVKPRIKLQHPDTVLVGYMYPVPIEQALFHDLAARFDRATQNTDYRTEHVVFASLTVDAFKKIMPMAATRYQAINHATPSYMERPVGSLFDANHLAWEVLIKGHASYLTFRHLSYNITLSCRPQDDQPYGINVIQLDDHGEPDRSWGAWGGRDSTLEHLETILRATLAVVPFGNHFERVVSGILNPIEIDRTPAVEAPQPADWYGFSYAKPYKQTRLAPWIEGQPVVGLNRRLPNFFTIKPSNPDQTFTAPILPAL